MALLGKFFKKRNNITSVLKKADNIKNKISAPGKVAENISKEVPTSLEARLLSRTATRHLYDIGGIRFSFLGEMVPETELSSLVTRVGELRERFPGVSENIGRVQVSNLPALTAKSPPGRNIGRSQPRQIRIGETRKTKTHRAVPTEGRMFIDYHGIKTPVSDGPISTVRQNEHGLSDVFTHEFGHYVDWTLGGVSPVHLVSKKGEYVGRASEGNIHPIIKGALAENSSKEMLASVSEYAGRPQESFPEVLARFYQKEPLLESSAGTQRYVKNVVGNVTENFKTAPLLDKSEFGTYNPQLHMLNHRQLDADPQEISALIKESIRSSGRPVPRKMGQSVAEALRSHRRPGK